MDLRRFVGDARFDMGADAEREGTRVFDEQALDEHLVKNLHREFAGADLRGPVFVESHFAHVFTFVDRIIVLRCRPSILKKRLLERGYSATKIQENLEVEGMDLILQEAVATREQEALRGRSVALAQVDTSTCTIEEAALQVLRLATTPSENLEIARIDWSDEVLGWY